jgi:hypothetical protein
LHLAAQLCIVGTGLRQECSALSGASSKAA